MNLRELEAQAKALAPMIKGVIDKAVCAMREALANDLNERDARLRDELSKALQPQPVNVEEVAQAAAALIPVPENGKDADPAVIRSAVAEAVAEIPKPKDGSSVTLTDVEPLLRQAVDTAISALPAPEPGKSVTPEDVRPLIAEEVAKLPAPKDGASVTVDDVAPLLQQAVSEAVAALPAPEPGKSVTPEEVRPLIAEEVAKAMQALQLPSDGQPGRDALQLEILPEINLEKSYARSVYARHRGGLWRSFERTQGIKGWECIVDGIDSLEIDKSGDRGFQVEVTLSSGARISKSLNVPVMIYRGVFTAGEYLPGDTVTWGGSLWHCDSATSDKPGEQGAKGWRLAVKRGRDGKDGTNGKDLTKGVTLK